MWKRLGQAIGPIAALIGIGTFVTRMIATSSDPSAHGGPLLWAGFCAACGHGLLWRGAELTLSGGSKFGGGGVLLPSGWEAVVLSLSMTLSLMFVPPLYRAKFGSITIESGHYQAMLVVVVTSALGHFLLYGTNSPLITVEGWRAKIFPLGAEPRFDRAVEMEFVYALVHFISIVFVYRIFTHPATTIEILNTVVVTASSLGVWLVFTVAFILFMYPDSLVDPTWVQVRGVINATALMMALVTGMLW